MMSKLRWEELIPRLEKDLRAARGSLGHIQRDDEAWDTVAQWLRERAKVFLLKYPNFLYQEDIEDIVQNVLVKLQSPYTMRRLRAARSVEGYIIVILRNTVIDLVRRRQRERTGLSELDRHLSARLTPSNDQLAARTVALAEALKSLTEDEQTLLTMRFWRNLSIREIAAKTNKSYSAVAVNLFRIIQRLRERMRAQA